MFCFPDERDTFQSSPDSRMHANVPCYHFIRREVYIKPGIKYATVVAHDVKQAGVCEHM